MRTANACRHTAMSHPEALHKMYQAPPCLVQALVAQQMRARAQRGALSFVDPANLQARFESTLQHPKLSGLPTACTNLGKHVLVPLLRNCLTSYEAQYIASEIDCWAAPKQLQGNLCAHPQSRSMSSLGMLCEPIPSVGPTSPRSTSQRSDSKDQGSSFCGFMTAALSTLHYMQQNAHSGTVAESSISRRE